VVARVDAWPEARLAVEVDGFAFHADRSRYRSDRRRGNGLVPAGWQVLRFSWEDVTTWPDVVVGRVRLALHR
jgi:very-short-patch-repair endonuclease